MKHSSQEAGALPIFRLFAALWLGLFLLGGGILLVGRTFSHQAVVFYLAGIANAILLLGYLLWPWLQNRLGNKYLPVGIVIASTGPIIINHGISLLPQGSPEVQTSFETWPLAVILFVPLVIVAWQHPLRDVIVYCSSTALLDLVLAIPAAGGDRLAYFSNAHEILARTVSFLLVGYMVARIMEIQNQQRRSLSEANVKLTHYAATLEQLATTRERNRLARELHDTLAHTLSAVAVEQEAVSALWDNDPAQAQALLERSLTATRSGLNETRRALQALRASPLEDLGLGMALRQETETVAERANLISVLNVPEHMDDLPPTVEQCVYRVAQEALANIAQHAQARHVEITLRRENGHLTLIVADDGQGFDPSAVDIEHHLGIQGMQERAEMMKGTLKIESATGQGTTIRLTIEEKT
jgi:signal transduction histidine kinase